GNGKRNEECKDEFSSMVSQELATTTPQKIEEYLRNYMHNHVITLQPPTRIPIHALQEKLYNAMKNSPQAQVVDLDMWVVLKEKFKQSLSLDEKRAPTIADIHRMKATLDDMMRDRCKTAAEYVYHIEQATNYMNNQIVWESREEDLMSLIPEKEAPVFFSP
ncbi:hypothetical protein Tco_1450753, partial [Tanacetum coccineum]